MPECHPLAGDVGPAEILLLFAMFTEVRGMHTNRYAIDAITAFLLKRYYRGLYKCGRART